MALPGGLKKPDIAGSKLILDPNGTYYDDICAAYVPTDSKTDANLYNSATISEFGGSNLSLVYDSEGGIGVQGFSSSYYLSLAAYSGLYNSNGVTVIAVVKAPSSFASANGCIVHSQYSSTVNWTLSPLGSNSSTTGFTGFSGAWGSWVNEASLTQSYAGDGQVHVVAGRYENGSQSLKSFLDGATDGTGSMSGTIPTTSNPLLIGRGQDSGYWGGKIYAVFVFNKGLSDAAIAEISANPYQVLLTDTRTYEDKILGDSPVSYWGMDEESGNISDLIGGNNATVTGTPTYSVDTVLAEGSAITTTSAQYFTTSSAALTSVTDCSFELWFKSTSTTGQIDLFDCSASGTYGYKITLNGDALGANTGAISVGIHRASNYIGVETTATTFNDGNWHHLVCTVNGSSTIVAGDFSIYVDGVKQATGTSTIGSGSTTPLTTSTARIAGLQYGGGGSFDGTMDAVAIYDYELTADQIFDHYYIGAQLDKYQNLILADAPVAYWKLDEATGTTAVDSIGSNNLTYTNTPTLDEDPLITTGSSVYFLDTNTEYAEANISNFRSSDTEGSVEFWFSSTNTGDQDCFFQSGDDGSFNQIYFQMRSGGYIAIGQYSGTDNQYRTTASFNDGNPHHVVIISDGSTWKIYVDGENQTLTSVSGTNNGHWFGDTPNRDRVVIGSMYRNGGRINNADAHIDEVAVYDYELTADQIKRHYDVGLDNRYAERIYSLQPVAYWQLDETSGTVALDTMGDNNLTYINTPTLNQASAITQGSSVSFNGSSQYAEYNVTDWQSTDTEGTIEGWVKTDNNSGTRNIFGIGDANSASDGMELTIDANGSIAFYNSNGAGTYLLVRSTATGYNDDNWHHFVVTSNGSAIKLYVDGASEALTVANGSNTGQWVHDITTGSTEYVTIGAFRRSSITNYIGGEIDEVAYYDYELTADQIRTNYQFGKAHIGAYQQAVLDSNPVAYWPLDEKSGTTIHEIITSNHNGTTQNSPSLDQTPLVLDGSSIDFNGTSQGIPLTTDPVSTLLYGKATGTFELWFNCDTWPTGANVQEIFMGKNGSNYHAFTIRVTNDDDIVFGLRGSDGTTNWDDVTISGYSAGTTYHLVGTFDFPNDELKIYINGVIKGTKDTSSNWSTETWPVQNGDWDAIGFDDIDNQNYFNGKIDQVAIYDYILSAEIIKEHYQIGLGVSDIQSDLTSISIPVTAKTPLTHNVSQSSYNYVIHNDSPAAYWKLDESSGTSADDDYGGYDGTYTNTPTLDETALIPTGSSVRFTAAQSEYVNITSIPSITGGWAIECWFKSNTTPNGDALFGESYSTNSQVALALAFGTSGGAVSGSNLYVGLYSLGSWAAAVSSSSTSNNTLYHVIGVADSTNLTLYVNGKEVAQSAHGKTLINPGDACRIATRWDSGGTQDYFDGWIDEVALYTSTTINGSLAYRHYAEGLEQAYDIAVLDDAPTGYWRLEEASGNAYNVVTGNTDTIQGTVDYQQTGYIDDNVYAIRCNGTTEQLRITSYDVSTFANTAFTMECWVKVNAFVSSNGGLIHIGANSADTCVQIIRNASNSNFILDFYGNGPATTWTPTTGTWYHIALVRDGNDFTFYVDGTSTITHTRSNINLTSDIINFGGRETTEYTDVTIQNAALYDRALTGTELTAHYNAGITLESNQSDITASSIAISPLAPTAIGTNEISMAATSIAITTNVPTAGITDIVNMVASSVAISVLVPQVVTTESDISNLTNSSIAISTLAPDAVTTSDDQVDLNNSSIAISTLTPTADFTPPVYQGYINEINADTPAHFFRFDYGHWYSVLDVENTTYYNWNTRPPEADFYHEPANCDSYRSQYIDGSDTTAWFAIPNATLGSKSSTDELTFACWLKFPSTITTEQPIFAKGSGTGRNFNFHINSSGKMAFEYNTTSVAGNTTLSANTWYFCAWTFNGSTVNFYLNGSSDGSQSASWGSTTTNDAKFFKKAEQSTYPTCYVDFTYLYTSVLSGTRISAHYTAGKNQTFNPYADQVYSDSPLLYWPFHEPGYDSGDFSFNSTTQHGAEAAASSRVADTPVGMIDYYSVQTNPSGQDDRVFCDGSPYTAVNGSEFTSSGTIEFWMKLTENGTDNSFDKNFFYFDSLRLYKKANANDIYVADSTASKDEDTTVNLVDIFQDWSHWVITFDSSGNIEIYVDGTSKFTGTGYTNFTATGDRTISLGYGNTVTNRFLTQLWSNFAIYDGTLSSTRISAHYTAGTNPIFAKTSSIPASSVAITTLAPTWNATVDPNQSNLTVSNFALAPAAQTLTFTSELSADDYAYLLVTPPNIPLVSGGTPIFDIYESGYYRKYALDHGGLHWFGVTCEDTLMRDVYGGGSPITQTDPSIVGKPRGVSNSGPIQKGDWHDSMYFSGQSGYYYNYPGATAFDYFNYFGGSLWFKPDDNGGTSSDWTEGQCIACGCSGSTYAAFAIIWQQQKLKIVIKDNASTYTVYQTGTLSIGQPHSVWIAGAELRLNGNVKVWVDWELEIDATNAGGSGSYVDLDGIQLGMLRGTETSQSGGFKGYLQYVYLSKSQTLRESWAGQHTCYPFRWDLLKSDEHAWINRYRNPEYQPAFYFRCQEGSSGNLVNSSSYKELPTIVEQNLEYQKFCPVDGLPFSLGFPGVSNTSKLEFQDLPGRICGTFDGGYYSFWLNITDYDNSYQSSTTIEIASINGSRVVIDCASQQLRVDREDYATYGFTFQFNEWYHIGVGLPNFTQELQLYVNGVKRSGVFETLITYGDDLVISNQGSDGENKDHWKGYVSGVAAHFFAPSTGFAGVFDYPYANSGLGVSSLEGLQYDMAATSNVFIPLHDDSGTSYQEIDRFYVNGISSYAIHGVSSFGNSGPAASLNDIDQVAQFATASGHGVEISNNFGQDSIYSAFHVAVWVYITSWTGTGEADILTLSKETSGTKPIRVHRQSGQNALQMTVDGTTTSAETISLNAWHLIVIRREQSTEDYMFYVDRTLVEEVQNPTVDSTYDTVLLGENNTSSNGWNGYACNLTVSTDNYTHTRFQNYYLLGTAAKTNYFYSAIENYPAWYYTMDQTSGSTGEALVAQSTATFYGTVGFEQGGNTDIDADDESIRFDTLDETLSVLTSPITDTVQTMEFWFYVDETAAPSSSGVYLAEFGHASSTTAKIFANIDQFNDRIRIQAIKDGYSNQTAALAYTRQQWNHFVMGHIPGTNLIEFYINGVLGASSAETGAIDNDGFQWQIGCVELDVPLGTYGQAYNIKYSHVAVYPTSVAGVVKNRYYEAIGTTTNYNNDIDIISLPRNIELFNNNSDTFQVYSGPAHGSELTASSIAISVQNPSADTTESHISNMTATSISISENSGTAFSSDFNQSDMTASSITLTLLDGGANYTEHNTANVTTTSIAISEQDGTWISKDYMASDLEVSSIPVSTLVGGTDYSQNDIIYLNYLDIEIDALDQRIISTQDNWFNPPGSSINISTQAPSIEYSQDIVVAIGSMLIVISEKNQEFISTEKHFIDLPVQDIDILMRSVSANATRDTDRREVFSYELGIGNTYSTTADILRSESWSLPIGTKVSEVLEIGRRIENTASLGRKFRVIDN